MKYSHWAWSSKKIQPDDQCMIEQISAKEKLTAAISNSPIDSGIISTYILP
jgi:hypothetical protein